MMKLDPSEEDSDDSGNGGRDSPVGEAGQMTDLEVCYSTVNFWPLPSYAGEILKHSNPRSFWICVGGKLGQGNHVIIFMSSISKAPFSKHIPSTLKRKAGFFKFLQFKERFRKAPFS